MISDDIIQKTAEKIYDKNHKEIVSFEFVLSTVREGFNAGLIYKCKRGR